MKRFFRFAAMVATAAALFVACSDVDDSANGGGSVTDIVAESSSATDLAAAMEQIAAMKLAGSTQTEFTILIPGSQSEDLDLSHVDLKIMEGDDNIEFKFADAAATRSGDFSIKGPEGWKTTDSQIKKKPRIKSVEYDFEQAYEDMGSIDDKVAFEYNEGRLSKATVSYTKDGSMVEEILSYERDANSFTQSLSARIGGKDFPIDEDEDGKPVYSAVITTYQLNGWIAESGSDWNGNYTYTYDGELNKYLKSRIDETSETTFTWSDNNTTAVTVGNYTQRYEYSGFDNNFDIDLNSALIRGDFHYSTINHDVMMRLLGKTSEKLVLKCDNGDGMVLRFEYNKSEIDLPTQVKIYSVDNSSGEDIDLKYTVKIEYYE